MMKPVLTTAREVGIRPVYSRIQDRSAQKQLVLESGRHGVGHIHDDEGPEVAAIRSRSIISAGKIALGISSPPSRLSHLSAPTVA